MSEVRRSALIVANDEYADPRLRRLRAPAADAAELARVLGSPEIGAFDVQVSVNEPEHVVRRRLSSFFDERGPDDVLLLHLSCHGVKDEDGRLYFATPDTEMEHLEATSIPSEFVNRQMTRSRSRRILLLLDCCYSGAFARGLMSRAGDQVDIVDRFDGRGRIVLTASSAMEYSFEGDKLSGQGRPSVFTSAVVDGLATGAADRNGDGFVSVDELYDYAYDRVRAVTPSQTPGKWVFDVQGDFYVARSVAPPPAEPGPPVETSAPPAGPPPEPPEAPDPPLPARLPAAARVGAAGLLAALPLPLLAADLERWNVWAALSPADALLAALAVLLLTGGTRAARVQPRALTGALTAIGTITALSAAGLVKFAAERIGVLGVLLALVALAGGLTVLAAGLAGGRGPARRTAADPVHLVVAFGGAAVMALAIFLTYDGDSSLWNEVAEVESAEFVLGPAAAVALVLLGASALGSWPRWGAAVVLAAGALGTVHFISLLIAAAFAIGEVGEVRGAPFAGIVGALAATLAGAAALRATTRAPTPRP